MWPILVIVMPLVLCVRSYLMKFLKNRCICCTVSISSIKPLRKSMLSSFSRLHLFEVNSMHLTPIVCNMSDTFWVSKINKALTSELAGLFMIVSIALLCFKVETPRLTFGFSLASSPVNATSCPCSPDAFKQQSSIK